MIDFLVVLMISKIEGFLIDVVLVLDSVGMGSEGTATS